MDGVCGVWGKGDDDEEPEEVVRIVSDRPRWFGWTWCAADAGTDIRSDIVTDLCRNNGSEGDVLGPVRRRQATRYSTRLGLRYQKGGKS